ncbi:MAG: RDD family protein [Vulcanimicrobiaceae bacterium]
MDRLLDVRTPESIAFSYELAGLGSRALAVLIDLLVQIALVALLFWGLIFAAGHLPAAHRAAPEVERFARNAAVGILIFIVFAIFFGYYIVLEALWNGQTIGKKALGIRVVRDGGYPIDWGASLIRNLVRVGEVVVGSYALSAICALLSHENKRIGDIAAGTIVVRDAPVTMALPAFEFPAEPVYAATGYVSGEERALIHRFIERRDTLQNDRRRELAAQLANRVRERVPLDLQRLDDESLLERL